MTKSNRKHPFIGQSSSKKTFTLNGAEQKRTKRKESIGKLTLLERAAVRQDLFCFRQGQSRKATATSLPLLDAYRFRDTLHATNTNFLRPRTKLS